MKNTIYRLKAKLPKNHMASLKGGQATPQDKKKEASKSSKTITDSFFDQVNNLHQEFFKDI